MSFQRSRWLLAFFGVVVAFAPRVFADVPKADDPYDDRNHAAAGTRSEEEIKECQGIAAKFKGRVQACKDQAEESLKREYCDDESAKQATMNSGQSMSVFSYTSYASPNIGTMTGTNDSCKAASNANGSSYGILDTLKGTCELAKKKCDDACAGLKKEMGAVKAACNQEMAPGKQIVYSNARKCGELQPKIDKMKDQIQIVKNSERALWSPTGCMKTTAADSNPTEPDNPLHKALKFDDRFGDPGPTDYQLSLKSKEYRTAMGISDADAERLLATSASRPLTMADYGYAPTWSSATPDYRVTGLSDADYRALSQQYAPSPGPQAYTPSPGINAMGPNTGPSVNNGDPQPAMPVASQMPTAPVQQQSVASSAPQTPNAYDITALPQTPKYDETASKTTPTEHSAGALYGGRNSQSTATTAAADSASKTETIPDVNLRTVGGIDSPAPAVAASTGASTGITTSSASREFMNSSSNDPTQSGPRGPAAANTRGADSAPSSIGGRARSWISSLFSSDDDKTTRPRGSDFRLENQDRPEDESHQVDLRQFLPGEAVRRKGSSIAGMNPLRFQGIHGSETILWNAVNDRYRLLEPTLIKEP